MSQVKSTLKNADLIRVSQFIISLVHLAFDIWRFLKRKYAEKWIEPILSQLKGLKADIYQYSMPKLIVNDSKLIGKMRMT